MTGIDLSIERLVVETAAEKQAAGELPEVVRAALRKLAERLSGVPLAREVRLAATVRARVEIDTLPLDALLGPRGADRLAEELYQRIVRGIR